MPKVRDISEYFLMGDFDANKVKQMHETAGEFRERFLEDKILQNVLLNKGYELEKNYKSFLDILDSTINRSIIAAHLTYINKMTDLMTTPQLAVITTPVIIIPGKEEVPKITTPSGMNLLAIESLQEEWRNNPVSETVGEYQKYLNLAFDEYNMKFMAGLIDRAKMHFINSGKEWAEERKIQERINKVADSRAYSILDSAYYNMGNRFFNGCGALWKKLDSDEFGKFFILYNEDVHEFMKKRVKIIIH
jgi:hypothetical protein